MTALRSPEGRDRMLAAVDAADLVIVSFPLYIDQLPAPLLEALELIAEHRKAQAARPGAEPTRPRDWPLSSNAVSPRPTRTNRRWTS